VKDAALAPCGIGSSDPQKNRRHDKGGKSQGNVVEGDAASGFDPTEGARDPILAEEDPIVARDPIPAEEDPIVARDPIPAEELWAMS
jgi:hypothetical protein